MSLKYKVGDVVVLAENVEQNWRKTFVPGVAVKIEDKYENQTCNDHYTVTLKSDPSDFWCINDSEINHEATAKLQTSNESGSLVQKISVENDVVSYAVNTSDNGSKSQDNSWYENGELPPVGTKCVFFSDDFEKGYYWNEDLTNECEVEILAHFKSHKDCSVADVVAFVFEHNGNSYQVEQAIAGCFRPIQTPEQIAAQERKKVIEELRSSVGEKLGIKPCYALQWRVAEAIYDLGYRKLEE